MIPVAFTTAVVVLTAVGQMTPRWNGIPDIRPPPSFFVSM